VSPDHSVGSPPAATNLKMAQWRFAVEYVVRSQNMESRLHAVEGVYYVGHGTIDKAIFLLAYRHGLRASEDYL
jgi:hypothetical protein